MEQGSGQPNFLLTTLLKIKQFHADGIYWDVQLEVDSKIFKCQRSILAANSEYFDNMFRSRNFKESNANVDQPITLTQMDATTFEQILHFMYTGDISVTDSNVLQMLSVSDYLRLGTSHFKEQCLEHVKSRSREDEPISDAFELLCFASLKEENVLVDTMNAHICRHLYHYSKDTKLMEISFENLNALVKFSRNYILPFSGSADVLLKIIHNWVNRNRKERSQYRCKLMENVDAANVSSNFAVSLINKMEYAVDDEVLNRSRNLEESPSYFKTFEVDICPTGKDAPLDGLISFNVKNLIEQNSSKLYEIRSASHIISNLSWNVGIVCIDDYLLIYLECNGRDLTSAWYCYANAIFALKSHKERTEDLVVTIPHRLFSNQSPKRCKWGSGFLKLSDLIDPEKGFINDDKSITIDTHVHVDVPFLKMT